MRRPLMMPPHLAMLALSGVERWGSMDTTQRLQPKKVRHTTPCLAEIAQARVGRLHASTVLGRSLKKNASHADAPAQKRVRDTLQREQEGASHVVVIQLELEQQLEQKLEYRDYAGAAVL